jgi:hypothetical protein
VKVPSTGLRLLSLTTGLARPELEHNGHDEADADADDNVTDDPETLWSDVLAPQRRPVRARGADTA